MNAGNWIDLGLLLCIAVWVGSYTWHVIKTRHRYKSITVQRGLGRITVEGLDAPEAVAAIRHLEGESA